MRKQFHLIGICSLFLWLFAPYAAFGTVITVTHLADDGTAGSLRASIWTATAGDTIAFQEGLEGTLTLSMGELVIDRNLTIIGNGRQRTIISANSLSRVVRIPNAVTVRIERMGFTAGLLSGNTAEHGAGILNNGTLTLFACDIFRNRSEVVATDIFGGGICNFGELNMRFCRVFENEMDATDNVFATGAGIKNIGNAEISHCEIHSNFYNQTGTGAAEGAGIDSDGSGSILRLTNSLIFNNEADAGSGVFLGFDTQSEIHNTTFSGNIALLSGLGAGLTAHGVVDLRNVTIFNNTGVGFEASTNSTSQVFNCILADNSGGNFLFAPSSLWYIQATSADDTTLPSTTSGNEPNATISLSNLGFNGGFTRSHLLDEGSAGINSGDNSLATGNDQRGYQRIADGNVDRGSTERNAIALEPNSPPSNWLTFQVSSDFVEFSFRGNISPVQRYLVLRRESGSSTAPTDGVFYPVGSTLNGQTVVSNSTDNWISDRGLQPGKQYFYDVYAYNGLNAATNYLQTSWLSGELTTAVPPTIDSIGSHVSTAGQMVWIYGQNFPADFSQSHVFIGNTLARVAAGGTDSVQVELPINFPADAHVSLLNLENGLVAHFKQTTLNPSFTGEIQETESYAAQSVNLSFNAQLMARGDLNSDGLTDFVLADPSNNSARIFYLTTDGNLSSGATLPTPPQLCKLIIQDLNQDGHNDIAMGGAGSSTLGAISIWLQNTADDAFEEHVLEYTQRIIDFEVADLNGNGYFDIAASSRSTTGVEDLTIFYQDPLQDTLITHEIMKPGNEGRKVALADFNNDGQTDIAALNNEDGSQLLIYQRNNNNSGFSAPATYNLGAIPSQLTVRDFDRNGLVDVAILLSGSLQVQVMLQQSVGDFVTQTVQLPNEGSQLVARDVDGDGLSDLLISSPDAAGIFFLLNKSGNFAEPLLLSDPFSSPAAIEAIDLNTDGKTDLLVSDVATGELVTLLYTPQPLSVVTTDPQRNSNRIPDELNALTVHYDKTLGNLTNLDWLARVYGSISGYKNSAAVSVNDSILSIDPYPGFTDFAKGEKVTVGLNPDIIAADDGKPEQAYSFSFRTQPETSLAVVSPFDTLATTSPSSGVLSAFISADQRPDLIVADTVNNTIQVYLESDADTFAWHGNINLSISPTHIERLDLNNDGHLDLVAIDAQSAKGVVAHGDGNGGFTSLPVFDFATSNAISDFQYADYNGSGFNDLLVALKDTGAVVFCPNNGNGALSANGPFYISTTTEGIKEILTEDLDNDGLYDIITLHHNGGGIHLMYLNRDGEIARTGSLPAASYGSMAIADFNGDFWQDIAVWNGGQQSIQLFVNDRAGNFNLDQQMAYTAPLNSLLPADMNGDGFMDLIAHDVTNAKLLIFTNDGGGVFSQRDTLAVGNALSGWTLADMNQDGDLDLALTFHDQPILVLAENENSPTIELDHQELSVGEFMQGTDSIPVYAFSLKPTINRGILQRVSIKGGGNYTNTDLKNNGVKLWASSTTDFSNAVPIDSLNAIGTGETLAFDGWQYTIPKEKTHYFWITADLAQDATIGNQLVLEGLSPSELGFAYGNISTHTALPDGDTLRIIRYIKPEPSSHVTNLTATQASASSIVVTWQDATGEVLPDGYLIVGAREGSPFPAITDSIPIANEEDWSDGVVMLNRPHNGSTSSYTFSELAHSVKYTFRVYPFSNNGTDINYKTDSVPTDSTIIIVSPSVQATNLLVDSIYETTANIRFSAGDGMQRLVIMKAGNPVDQLPNDNMLYTDGLAFGAGQDLGSGNFALYSGTDSSLTVTDLSPNTEYFVRVFEFNTDSTTTDYLVGTATGNPTSFITTAAEPLEAANSLDFSLLTETSLGVSFQPPANHPPEGYLVLRRINNAPTPPSDRTTYAVGSTFGGQRVVHMGSATTFNDLGLNPEQLYHYDVYAYNGQGNAINYLTTSYLSGSYQMPAPQPITQALGLTLTEKTETSAAFSWINGDGTGRLVVVAERGQLALPTDTTRYLDNTAWGTADSTGVRSFVVYSGSADSLSISGLLPGTEYEIAIFEYNGSGNTLNYLTATSSGNLLQFTTFAREPVATSMEWQLQAKTETTLDISLSFASASNADSVMVLRRLEGEPRTPPADGTYYPIGTTLGGQSVVSNGEGLTFSDAGLQPSTSYRYEVYLYNGTASSINYLATPVLSFSATTLAALPSVSPSNLAFTLVNNRTIAGQFAPSDPAADGYLILYGSDSGSTALPQNGLVYAPGDYIGPFQVISSDTSKAFALNGLHPETRYHFRVMAFNGEGNIRHYRTTDILVADTVTVNSAPQGLTLSHNVLPELAQPGSFVGSFSISDPDPSDTHQYTLVMGDGDTDNALFSISGDSLQVAATIDASQPNRSILVRATDQLGGFTERAFTILVEEIPLNPADSAQMVMLLDSLGTVGNWSGSEPIKDWDGVTVYGGRVISLDLSGLGLTHLHTEALLGLDSLQQLNISANHLLPEFLHPFLGMQLDSYTYAPQTALWDTDTLTLTSEEGLSLAIPASIGGSQYQWAKDDLPIEGATDSIFSIVQLNSDDAGMYTCEMVHTDLPELLYRFEHTLLRVVSIMNPTDSLALVQVLEGLYEKPIGEIVDVSTPAASWPFVEEDNGRVVAFEINGDSLPGVLREEIGELTALQRLSISHTGLSGNLPTNIGNLTALTYLDLFGNNLSGALPESLGNLQQLRTLWLANNALTQFPESIGNLQRLAFLFVQDNLLTSLPEGLGSIGTLEMLDASDNRLTGLPTNFNAWQSLRILKLGGNLLQMLPSDVSSLSELQELDLSNNAITELPDFSNLLKLEQLLVFNNHLDFSDIERLDYTGTFYRTYYAPQKPLSTDTDTLVVTGNPFTITAGAGGSANRYLWEKGGEPLSGRSADTLYFAPMTKTDAALYQGFVSSDLVPGLVLQTGKVRLFADCNNGSTIRIGTEYPTTFCEGENVFVSMMADTLDPSFDYQWLKDGSALALAKEAEYVAFAPGTYRLRITKPDGCSVFSNRITIEVLPTPLVVLSSSDSATLHAQIDSQLNGSFTWYLDGQPIADADGATLHVSRSGNYQVGFTAENGCEGLSEARQMVVTSISSAPAPQEIILAPNPAIHETKLFLPQTIKGELTLRIFDLSGRMVSDVQTTAQEEVNIPLSGLPKGMYWLQVKGKGIQQQFKLLKE